VLAIIRSIEVGLTVPVDYKMKSLHVYVQLWSN